MHTPPPGLFRPFFAFARWLGALLTVFFGRLDWQAPVWLCWLGERGRRALAWMNAHRRATALGLVALLASGIGGWLGWQWYKNLPEPHTVDYRVQAPGPTDYERTPIVIAPLRVSFAESVAPLEHIGKPVVQGLSLDPAVPGEWRWNDDRSLEFKPQGDWPVAGEYQIHFADEDFFAGGVLLRQYQATFKTTAFRAEISEGELYQDPVDSNLKKLVATVKFSHPVDEAALRERIQLKLGEGLKFREVVSEPWALTLDKTRLHAYVHSAPLAVPLESVPLTLNIVPGLRAARGGNATEAALEREVLVPGRYRLTFDDMGMNYVNNERGEPEQLLMFNSAFPVSDEVIRKHVRAWLLPETRADSGSWWGVEHVTEALLKRLEPVNLTQVPSAEPLNSHHSFKFKVPVGRYVYVQIAGGVEAVGGYLSKKPATTVFQVAEYPQALKLMADGALLSLAGEKKIGFMAQGVPGVRVEIARLLPNQLHHLIDQNYERFAKPSVYGEGLDRLVERMEFTREFPQADPAKPIYDHIDLGAYLNADGGRRGVFVLRITPYDPTQPQRDYGDYSYGDSDSDSVGDRRFVLVTDLGIITKRGLDGSQDVFVQSIASGAPVAGATVDVMGRNGLPVQSATTDAEGRISFPKLGELRREKTPLMFVVSLGTDLSFLPLTRGEHRLDFSRFDIGGLSNASSPDQLSAYLFTDRGLYRPGETAHIAYILRTADWSTALAGVPIDITITDPRGAVVMSERRALPASGLDAIDFASSDVAPAGEYTAAVYLIKDNSRDALLGSVAFKVRDFEPDRMKVSTTLSPTPVEGWIAPNEVKARVQARHLFGAPASARRVTAEMRLSPAFPAFARYPEHRFHWGEVVQDAVKEELLETKTDETGAAELVLGLQRFARSTYRLHVIARVFEAEGGRNVAAEQAVLVSSAPYLVGVKTPDPLDYVSKGSVRKTDWLAVGPDLLPIAADKLSLTRLEYRYVSVLVKRDSGAYQYESRRKELVRDSRALSLPAGGTELVLPTDEPGDFAYVLRDAEGNELNRVSWTVAGAGNLTRSLERNAELQLKLDKPSYAPGETISISVRAPYVGAGLITIERDKVYAHRWFKADSTASVQTIAVPQGLEGNAYVNVQFVRDPASPEVYMSPLSYGVAPFAVNLDARRLKLDVEAPATLEPGQTLKLKVNTGEAARAVVFAIDEGILQVARYKTPDPLAHFFQKRALEVDTAQILDLILPEFSHLLNAAAPGGDADGALGRNLNPFKRKRQGPAAYWSGVVDIPAEGRELSYVVPDNFNGKLRLMAVAVTAGRIGVYEGGTEVRGPWVLTPNVPAFVAPGDEFSVSVGVFSNLKQKAEVSLALKTSAGLKTLGEGSIRLSVEPQKEGVAEFRLRASEVLGSADLAFQADSPGVKAAIRETVSVRPATPYRVDLRVGHFETSTQELKPVRVLHDELRKVEMGLAHSPLVWAQGLANYLGDYPYSCTEQLVSKAMPALVWATPEELARGDLPMVRAAFSTLRQRQNEQGGFGLWAANPIVEPEVSVYAADFLVEAKARGVSVAADLLARSRAYLEQVANGPAEGMTELRTRVQAAYLLTRLGVVTTGALASAMEQLESYHAKTWRKDITAAYLAASHRLLKQERQAQALIQGVPWRTLAKDAAGYDTYYDGLVHDAELLNLLALHFPERLDEVPPALLDALGQRLSKNQYHSLSAALLVRALDRYGQGAAAQGGALKAVALLKDQTQQVLNQTGRPPRVALPQGFEGLHLEKAGELPAFYLVSEAGFDRGVPPGELKQGLEIVREFLSLDGKPLAEAKVGEEFLVRLRLRATERDSVSQIAVIDLLPGGVEPVFNAPVPAPQATAGNSEGSPEGEGEAVLYAPAWQAPIGEPGQSDWRPEYADVRDDRVVLYGTVSRDVASFVYRVRATNAGRFQAPPPYAEGMYERSLQGRGIGATFTIVKP